MRYILFIALLFSCNLTFSQKYVAEYFEKYTPLAVGHERKYGIPASITLAQAALESGYGRSRLARVNKNHFGIKSGSRYMIYSSAEYSFSHHARVLQSERYKLLFKLDISDYKGWAHGLYECGYAQDSLYAKKLIFIIEKYIK